MEQSMLRYFKLHNKYYKHRDAYSFLFNMKKRDQFEEDVMKYAKKHRDEALKRIGEIDNKNKNDLY